MTAQPRPAAREGPLVTRRVVAVLACLLTVLLGACGSQAAPAAGPGIVVRSAPLTTSLVTAQGAWAITAMGRPADAQNTFWQLLRRPAGGGRWSLVTPPGVADNGGLVAASGAGDKPLMVGVRPSQLLTFSPLAMSSDGGQNWTPGLLDAALADGPDALALGASGRILGLLRDGTIEAAPSAAAAAAGQWSQLTTLAALAASVPGRRCGLAAMNAVLFGPDDTPMAAGSCLRPGVAGVFADHGGVWQATGPALPAGHGGDQVQVLGLARTSAGEAALLLAGTDLLAAWQDGTRWTVSAPIKAAGGIAASGFATDGSVWVLLGSGRAEILGGAGAAWRALPPVPLGTTVLVPPVTVRLAPKPSGAYEALSVSGSVLTVWRLGAGTWIKVQVIVVPLNYGSSA
jgi:hypothetical protein